MVERGGGNETTQLLVHFGRRCAHGYLLRVREDIERAIEYAHDRNLAGGDFYHGYLLRVRNDIERAIEYEHNCNIAGGYFHRACET